MLNPNNLLPKPAIGRSEYGRVKVALPPGKGLMDWVRLSSGKVLSKKRSSGVNEEELMNHSTQNDCWIVLFGQVYDVTQYLDFHPGGVPELMRAAGRDATALFNQYHAWVNYENMLKSCLVGPFCGDSNKLPPCGPSTIDEEVLPNPTNFASPSNVADDVKIEINKSFLFLISNYWANITSSNVVASFSELQSHLRVLVRPFKKPAMEIIIPLCNKLLYDALYSIDVDMNKIILLFDTEEINVIKAINMKTKLVKKRPAVQYHKCEIENVSNVSHDTLLYDLILPKCSYFHLPLGQHVSIKIKKGNATVFRPYTPISCTLPTEESPGRIQFIIKIYSDGICTPALGKLKKGDILEISDPIGDTDIEALIGNDKSVIMLAAGTGITPMIPIIRNRINERIRPPTKLIFYNKTEKDIVDDICIPMKWEEDLIEITHILSAPSTDWKGLTGRIHSSHIPPLDKLTQVFVCGPEGFVTSAMKILEEANCNMSNLHIFQG